METLSPDTITNGVELASQSSPIATAPSVSNVTEIPTAPPKAGMSLNQPKLCPNATWNENGTTFADGNTIGTNPQTIFVSSSNTVYASNFQNGNVQIWLEGSTNVTRIIVTNSTDPFALIVSSAGYVYIDNGYPNLRVEAWREGATTYASAISTGGTCWSLFIDTNSTLYCSLHDSHMVIKRSLDSNSSPTVTVAGTGCSGYQPNMLRYPRGIVVATNFDVYVADTDNHRVQLFKFGQLDGITVISGRASGTIQLRSPTAVMLDGDGYIFILDTYSFRVVGSGTDGFRCVVGCTSGYGSGSNQLRDPRGMAFDSYGNIYVADTDNNRLQKFDLSSNSCSK